MRALGIDVSLGRGLDVVCLDDDAMIRFGPVKASLADLPAVVERTAPDVIAIDSPPAWAMSGRSRPIESQLLALGIGIYATPTDPGDHKFYRWMRVGFEAFQAVAGLGYPLYRGGPLPARCAVEVFPHASAVVLRGSLPAPGLPKLRWRREVLEKAGIATATMTTVDQLDAALAAVTGLRCLQGTFSLVGEPGQAVLVLPVAELPYARFHRDASEEGFSSVPATGRREGQPPAAPLYLCACGCGAMVSRRYRPGHDARHRSHLVKRARAGDPAARATLAALGWE